MSVRLVEPPATEPVSLDLVKKHLRVEDSASDDLIALYISAARGHIENWCHIAVAEALWELTLDSFPAGAISIPNPPLISVDSVGYDDSDGNAQTFSEDSYVVDASGKFGWVVPLSAGWPSTISAINAVRIRYRAGYATNSGDASDVPMPLQQAILLLVGQYFDNREAITFTGNPLALPFAVEALISPYRVPVIA